MICIHWVFCRKCNGRLIRALSQMCKKLSHFSGFNIPHDHFSTWSTIVLPGYSFLFSFVGYHVGNFTRNIFLSPKFSSGSNKIFNSFSLDLKRGSRMSLWWWGIGGNLNASNSSLPPSFRRPVENSGEILEPWTFGPIQNFQPLAIFSWGRSPITSGVIQSHDNRQKFE